MMLKHRNGLWMGLIRQMKGSILLHKGENGSVGRYSMHFLHLVMP